MTNEIGCLIQVDKETKEEYKYPVSKDYLIGNSAVCDFRIVDEKIADQHCRIRLIDNEVRLYSLSVESPVFLNDEPVLKEGKALKNYDKIRINDGCQFEWNSTDRRIFSRSFAVEKERPSEENTRYSDSALTRWRNVDNPFQERVNVSFQNHRCPQEDEWITEKKSRCSKTESVEKSSVPVSCEVECGKKIEHLANTPVKYRKSKNPVSPFAVSNTFVSDSKNSSNTVLHCNDNDETEMEYDAKNTPEDVFEDLIMQHSTSQKPFHSTPKVTSGSKNRKNTSISSSSLINRNFEDNSLKSKSLHDMSGKNSEFDEKTSCEIHNRNDEKKVNSALKKNLVTPTKRTSDGCGENRRNTRGRTLLLRKTFEENSCDNENKSLTTPEKLTETNTVVHGSFPINSDVENVTDTNAELKYLDESSKPGFASVSDENETCEGSFIDKYGICNVVRNVSASKNPMVAKCARNLSHISPPENNRSQEYMESMTTTPQKDSLSEHESITEDYDVSLASGDETSMDRSLSSARKRRSTGFTPFVGTPSNEYRVTRKVSTPFSKSLLSRTSVDFESNAGPLRDGKYSSERRSTPFKIPTGKSSIRDSIACQPTILESVSFEELETSNRDHDSTNDSKFRFITMRRGRRCENIFAAKDKILEESELKSDDSQLENDGSFEEENIETSASNTSISSAGCDDLSMDEKAATETLKNGLELKSILTPLPKCSTWKEKSGKKVTFVLPNSPECVMDKKNSTLSDDESFAMISTVRIGHSNEQSLNLDNVTFEEEHLSNRQDTDPSCNSLSEFGDNSSIMYSVEENCDESSVNVSGVQHLTRIQSSLNDLSGVEQMEPSPAKCGMTMETNEQKNGIEIDTLGDTSNYPSVNFTTMSSFRESSNRSNLCDKIKSLKELAQIVVDERLENSSPTKISCSPGILLSGVKSLFNTPEKLRFSAVDKGIKCNLDFTTSPSTTPNARNTAEVTSSTIRKSEEGTKNHPIEKPLRMCKSLNLNKIAVSKSETSPAKVIQVEHPEVTAEIPENEQVSSVCNDESTSDQEKIEIDTTNEKIIPNFEVPDVIVTEPSFVDENANAEQIELVNENQEKLIKPLNVESSTSTVLDNTNDKPETSEIEQESALDRDETLPSEDNITDDGGSPVLTQIRRSALLKTLSDSKISPFNDEIQTKEKKSFTTTSILENESKKDSESSCSLNILPVNLPSKPTDLPEHENTERLETEFDAIISDFDSSQLSNISSTEYIGDTDSLKISINSSTCNHSMLSDFSVKDTSDLDFVKTSQDNYNLHLSDVSVNNTSDSMFSRKSASENNIIHPQSDELLSAGNVAGDEDSLENNVNRKTKIVECLSAEVALQNSTFEDVQKLESTVKMHDTDLINVSQSTSSSQDMGIRIDASSCLINDLHKELESTPQESNPSNDESTPTETFKPISFPESSNVSIIECAPQSKPENFNKPSSAVLTKIHDNVLTPIKTTLRGSSTPQSAIRRCRNSLRIHKCNADQTTSEACTSLHECSIILDKSLPSPDAENAKKPEEFQDLVVDETNIEIVDVGENVDNVPELLDEENIAEKINEPMSLAESVSSADVILSIATSSQSESNKTTANADVSSLLTEDEQTDHLPETQNSESVSVNQEELSDVRKIIMGTSKVPILNENAEKTIISSSPLLATQSASIEQTNSLLVDTVSSVRRSLRTRKEQPMKPVEESSKREVVARNRKRGRPALWYGKQFHCYLCLNSPENSKTRKCSRKTKPVERKLNEPHDDKENVCSLLKGTVVGKLKKTELPGDEMTVAVTSTTEKKTKRPPRRLKNLENLAINAESEQNIEHVAKRSCSIVLPILDPEIIKSPVTVDESGNISISEGPSIRTKSKRVTKAANGNEPKSNSTVSRTRQKQSKVVTFQVEENKSNKAAQQSDEKALRSKASTSKRNLRNQTSTTEEAATEINDTRKQLKTGRTTKIRLETLNNDAELSEPETVEKKTRAKRGTATLKNTETTNKTTNEKKPRIQTSTKRAQENVEESVPKRRRGKNEVVGEITFEETRKLEKDAISTKSPKKTRTQTKTSAQVEPVQSGSRVRSTRSTKNKPLEDNTSGGNVGSKKRIREVEQSPVLNDTKKPNKKAKILKNTELSESTVKKTAKKTNSTEDNSTCIVPDKELPASSSKTISRVTRSRKVVVLKESNPVKNITKGTRVTRNKNLSASKSSPTIGHDNLIDSISVKKSSAVEKVKTKRAVVTRSKKLSIKKGRISSTLKTSGKGAIVSRKSVIKLSPPKVTPEDKSVSSRLRITRSRAK